MPYKDRYNQSLAVKRYNEKHREEISEYQRGYYQRHREQVIARSALRHQLNKAHCNELNCERRRNLKTEVITHYGNGQCTCVKCGFNDIRALSIDHINGGGCRQKQETGLRAGSAIYAWLKRNNYPDGYQTLCHNCQWIKRDERHEYYNYLGHKEIFKG